MKAEGGVTMAEKQQAKTTDVIPFITEERDFIPINELMAKQTA